MRIILKEPGRDPRRMTIDGSLKTLQDLVGGYIEHIGFSRGVGILVNEEGKLLDLPPNFCLAGKDMLAGNVLFVGEEGEEFTDIPDEDADRILQLFSQLNHGVKGVMP